MPTHAPIDAEVLLRHSKWLAQLARALVARDEEIDDVVQQTYAQALAQPPRHRTNLRGWLGAVARNVVRSRARSDAARLAREAALPPPPAPETPDEALARAELRRRVVEAVLALAEPYRGAVILRFFEEQEIAAIARVTKAPEETVRTRVRRGIALVKETLLATTGGDARGGAASQALLFLRLAQLAQESWKGAAAAAAATGTVSVGAMVAAKWIPCAAAIAVATAAAWVTWPSRGARSEVANPSKGSARSETAAARDGRIAVGNSESVSAAARVPDSSAAASTPADVHAVPAAIPKSGTIRGVVKNHLGRPVAGATVQPLRESSFGRWNATEFAVRATQSTAGRAELADLGAPAASTTDGEGRFECSGLSCFTDWAVGAFDAQFGANVTEAVHFADDGALVEVALELAPRVHVLGTVRNELGEPMGGVPVIVNAATGGKNALTSSMAPDVGTWDIGWICAKSFGAQANAKGFWGADSGSLDVDLPNQERVVELVLRKFDGMTTVTGPILDEAGGALDLNARLDRLRGAGSAADSLRRNVCVVGFDDANRSAIANPRTATFDPGAFQWPVVGERLGAGGDYGTVDRERATYEVPLPLAFHGELALVVDGIVAALARIEDVSHAPPLLFSLPALPRTPCATVAVGAIDAATGEPIELTDADCWVDRATLEQPSHLAPSPGRSLKGGRDFTGPLGRIAIRVRHPGYATSATEIETARDGERREVTLPLDRAVAGLRGRMLDSAGKPQPCAEVRIYRRTLGSYVDCLALPVETNASGAFEVLGLAADEYVVVVQSGEVSEMLGVFGAGVARVRAADPPTEFEVRGRPATHVSVRLVRASGVGERPTMFRFVDDDGIPVVNMFGAMCKSYAAGSAGAFLVPGHYRLFVWSKGSREATTEFDVPAAGPLELRLEPER